MLPIKILFEDDALLVIDKPAGIAVHEDGHTDGPFVTDWIREQHPALVGVGEPQALQNGTTIDRPGVVHRLDRDTSGVLMLAKTQDAFVHLKAQFQNRETKKLYHAFVWGELQEPTGTIDKPIGRSRKDFRLWTANPPAHSKVREAITRYTVLARGSGCTYVAIEPKTGRTHQIRVHMKAVGHPVVCDSRYGSKKGCGLGFERLALHAHALSLTHPNGARVEYEAPLPEDFLHAVEVLQSQVGN